MKRHRIALFLACLSMGGAAASATSCGTSSNKTGYDGGGGGDASGNPFQVDSGVSSMDSSPPPDTFVPPADTGAGDTGCVPPEAGPPANCSPITGACDIVSQNCPQTCTQAYECDAVFQNGTFKTQCTATQLSQHLPKGHGCCPSPSSNQCDQGLECIGNTCDPDAAAPPTGRCTPHCCAGDGGDSVCGTSVPEGYPGHCDLQIVDNSNNPLYNVCLYAQPCVPLDVEPCASGYTCIVADQSGTATCVQIFNPGGDAGGLGAGAACSFTNQCADGLMCLTAGTSNCYWLCWMGPDAGATPFDAGVLNSMPGSGGCPMAQSCHPVSGFPAWLGFCQ